MVAHIVFRRASPKHNRLFLSPSPEIERGIRLEAKPDGTHTGHAYLRAGDCVKWRWVLTGTPEHSQPTGSENVITLTTYSLTDD